MQQNLEITFDMSVLEAPILSQQVGLRLLVSSCMMNSRSHEFQETEGVLLLVNLNLTRPSPMMAPFGHSAPFPPVAGAGAPFPGPSPPLLSARPLATPPVLRATPSGNPCLNHSVLNLYHYPVFSR